MHTAHLSAHHMQSQLSPAVHALTHKRVHAIVCLSFKSRATPEEVHAFKTMLLESDNVLQAVDMSGAYDFMVEAAHADLTAYRDFMESLRRPLTRLVTRHEESIICQRFVRQSSEDAAVWVPTAEGMKRVDCFHIDKVTAEGDYMRVHSEGCSWLLHTTMASLMQQLGSDHFMRVHRSAIVRTNFIDCLVHEGRNWLAYLQDGTCQRISRTRTAEILEIMRGRSTTPERGSSTQ